MSHNVTLTFDSEKESEQFRVMCKVFKGISSNTLFEFYLMLTERVNEIAKDDSGENFSMSSLLSERWLKSFPADEVTTKGIHPTGGANPIDYFD